jgi:hypothetical protein
MKRNKEKARAMRNGKSPYARHGKRPDQRDQQITAQSRKAAHGGKSDNA